MPLSNQKNGNTASDRNVMLLVLCLAFVYTMLIP